MKVALFFLFLLSSSYVLPQTVDWSWSDVDRVKNALLDHKANLDLVDKNGMTALLNTTSSGLSNLSEELIKSKRANINVKNSIGMTPLMFATKKGSLRTVRSLIEAKAELDSQDLWGYTALHYAVISDNFATFEALVNAKAKLDLVESMSGNTVLMSAVFQGKIKYVELLVKNKADVNIRNFFGHRAVLYATNQEMVKLLGGKDDLTQMYDDLFKNNRVLIKEPFDYSKLWLRSNDQYTDVLILGEYHADKGIFEDLVAQIAQASKKKKIITTFATEFVHSNEQAIMNIYQNLNIPTKIMSKKLRLGDKINNLLDEINSMKIPIIGLDIPFLPLDDNTSYEKGSIAYNNLINEAGMNERNTLWTDIVSKELTKNPSSKILLYCGVGHSDYAAKKGKPISLRLADKNYKVTVIRATLEPEYMNYNLPDHICATARRPNIQQEKFIIFVPKDKAKQMGADIFIHIPNSDDQAVPADRINILDELK